MRAVPPALPLPCSHSKFEFEYALLRRGVRRMVPVVMEPRCLDTTKWTGVVGGKLGSKLYCNLSAGAEDAISDEEAAIESIVVALRSVGVIPSLGQANSALLDRQAEEVEMGMGANVVRT